MNEDNFCEEFSLKHSRKLKNRKMKNRKYKNVKIKR